MKQIKIFKSSAYAKLAEIINQWIEEQFSINVIDIRLCPDENSYLGYVIFESQPIVPSRER